MQLIKLVRYVLGHPLNRGRGTAALCRLFRWQVAARLMPGPIAFPFVEDTRLLARRGMAGATGNWYCGLHEVGEMGFVLHSLRPDDLFLDVGANIGSYTVLAGGGVGARVVAVEPIPTTFGVLNSNIALNQLLERTRAFCVGLSDAPGAIRFSSGLDTVNHVMTADEKGSAVEVPVLTMDELLNGEAPAVIKIDVEGHERAVLQGGERTLSDSRVLAVVMEINGSGIRYGIEDAELLSIMSRHGFSPFSYDAIARRLTEWESRSGNAIFVRNREEMQFRVLNSKRYRLINGTI